MQGLNQLLDSLPLDNETGNVTLTLRNFGFIALDADTIEEQTFSVLNITDTTSTISPEQIVVKSEPLPQATGFLTPQELGSCNQRIIYSVFRTDALFLTPETACERFAVGSIILGVRVNNKSRCNSLSVVVNVQQFDKVYRMINFLNTSCR